MRRPFFLSFFEIAVYNAAVYFKLDQWVMKMMRGFDFEPTTYKAGWVGDGADDTDEADDGLLLAIIFPFLFSIFFYVNHQ